MRFMITAIGVASAGLLAMATPAIAGQSNQGGSATSQPRAQNGERRICRSEVETGRLASRRRRCFTATEWDRMARAARENAEQEFDRQRTRSAGE
jgi:hypothetical protein